MHSYEATARIATDPQHVFDRLDDQVKLAAHMTRPSAMMGGGRMTYEFDADAGRAVGSHTRMGGEAFGLKLFVDEVVTVREPPHRKTWETVGGHRDVCALNNAKQEQSRSGERPWETCSE